MAKNYVFPAPAGINRPHQPRTALAKSVPRASGDKPVGISTFSISSMCSPRQRG